MKILVAGLGKSGTTGLYYLVRNSLSGNPTCGFEPNYKELTGDEVLVKSLVGDTRHGNHLYVEDVFDKFDKRLFIVRDPRDRLVSGTLYSAATSRFKSREDLDNFLKLLRQKESDPNSVSMLDLRGWDDYGIYQRHGSLMRGWDDCHHTGFGGIMIECCESYEHCLVRYEDFVDGRIENMEDYLGFKLTGTSEVEPGLDRVVRKKTYGDWRNWLTPEDADLLKPIFANFMEHFDYDYDDWELNNKPVINPVFSSEYVERVWMKFNAWRLQ